MKRSRGRSKVYGLGLDLCDIARIRRAMEHTPRFCQRILGQAEYAQLAARGFPAQSVAASFAAKEAFAKAMGTGLRGFSLREVQLLRNAAGAPELCLSGAAAKLAAGLSFAVSVSHTRDVAAVVVLGEKES